MRISILIATYNRAQKLKKTLDSILSLPTISPHIFEVLVIDNNSKDNTKEVVDSFLIKKLINIVYIFEHQQGKVFALNKGIEEAQGDIFVFTDDDVTFDSNWLRTIIDNFESDEINCLTGKIVSLCEIAPPIWYSKKLATVIVGIDYSDKKTFIKWATGANMAFRKEVVKKVRGFDFLPELINEDVFFSKKLLENGYKIVYDPAMLVYHHFDSKRFTKKYFRKWYWLQGRAQAEIFRKDDLSTVRKIMNVPFYRYREFMEYVLGIIKNIFNEKERFCYELWTLRYCGFFIQRWKN